MTTIFDFDKTGITPEKQLEMLGRLRGHCCSLICPKCSKEEWVMIDNFFDICDMYNCFFCGHHWSSSYGDKANGKQGVC